MRFAVFSAERCSLAWQARLVDEGHDVLVYLSSKYCVGEGIVPLCRSLAQWEVWAREKPAETVVLFDTSRNGELADRLRRCGLRVVCAGGVCDKLEGDRRWAVRLAKLMGMSTPPSREFSYISDALAFVKKRPADEKWYFKPNRELGCSMTFGCGGERLIAQLAFVKSVYGDRIAHILQKETKGVAISTGAWWNGNAFLSPYEGTIEHKKFMNDELGPSTGCAFNVLWFYEEALPKIAARLQFPLFAEFLRREHAPPGIYDINAIIAEKDGEPYFLEHTARMGYDSEPTAQTLLDPDHIDGELGKFLWGLASGTLREAPFVTDEAALSVRVSIPPAPLDEGPWKGDPPLQGVDGLWEGSFVAYNVKRSATDRETYAVCDPMGLVGLGTARGTDLTQMNDEILAYLKDELFVLNMGYRTDAAKILGEDILAIRKAGYPTATMLTVEAP